MKPIDIIRDVKLKANGQWQNILSNLGAEVPLNTHTACPHCGGKDRFRFDNKDGDGTFICNQCGSGDGLDLVQRVLGGSATEAVNEVASMMLCGWSQRVIPRKTPFRYDIDVQANIRNLNKERCL